MAQTGTVAVQDSEINEPEPVPELLFKYYLMEEFGEGTHIGVRIEPAT